MLIAQDRDDEDAESHWRAKHDAKVAGLEKQRLGEGTGDIKKENRTRINADKHVY